MTDALRTLEGLRSETLDRARARLAQERKVYAQADALVFELKQRQNVADAELQRAVAGRVPRTPSDFAWIDRLRRAARLKRERYAEQVARAQHRLSDAEALVREAEAQLVEAEVGLRAVGQVVAKRESIRTHASALRAEEDAADAHRARRP